MFLTNDDSGIIFGIAIFVGFILVVWFFGAMWKGHLNRKARRESKIFSRYTELRKGMSRKEVLKIFEGLKPKVNKKHFISYSYAFRTSRILFTNSSTDEGERLELYFDKRSGELYDMKLYSTKKTESVYRY